MAVKSVSEEKGVTDLGGFPSRNDNFDNSTLIGISTYLYTPTCVPTIYGSSSHPFLTKIGLSGICDRLTFIIFVFNLFFTFALQHSKNYNIIRLTGTVG